MGYRLSRITTKSGDDGKTNLGDQNRIAKSHPKIIVLGDLDELSSAIGVVIAHLEHMREIKTLLKQVQQDLFDYGGELCPPNKKAITEEKILFIENAIKQYNNNLPPLTEFILPGGSKAAAFCHLARTVARRTERSIVQLHETNKLNPELLCYINRISDLLFILARILNKTDGAKDELWEHK